MGFDIHVVRRDSEGGFDFERGLYFARSDGEGWESLFRKDLKFTEYNEFISAGGKSVDWSSAYSEQVARSAEKFPLLTRLNDWYDDAEFLENEIGSLRDEIDRVWSSERPNAFLLQLKDAIEVANREGGCIVFVAD